MSIQPNREVALFGAALELPAGRRADYLDGACADDPALRESLAIRQKRSGTVHPGALRSLQLLVGTLRSQGKDAEAATMVLTLPDRELVALPGQTVAQIIHEGPQPQSKDLGDRILRGALTNAAWVNDVAWNLVIAGKPSTWVSALAVERARQAVAATRRKDAMILDTLAAAYAGVGQFTNAVSVQREAIALLQNEGQKLDCGSRLKLYQSNHPCRDHGLLAERATTLLQEGKFSEAELPARECLALREYEIPDDWRTFNARSLLGGSLLGQKKYADAEPLLLSGYEGLRQREPQIPLEGRPRLREALERLMQLYEATDRSDQIAAWKQKPAESDTTEKQEQRKDVGGAEAQEQKLGLISET